MIIVGYFLWTFCVLFSVLKNWVFSKVHIIMEKIFKFWCWVCAHMYKENLFVWLDIYMNEKKLLGINGLLLLNYLFSPFEANKQKSTKAMNFGWCFHILQSEPL